MEFAAVYEQLLNCQARTVSNTTVELMSRETAMQSVRLVISLKMQSVSLWYACAPAVTRRLSYLTCRAGSQAFCAGNLAGKGIVLLHEQKRNYRTLPAKQLRLAMLSISFGFTDFVEFVIGFTEGLTTMPTRMLYMANNVCAFKVATVVVSLVFQDAGVQVVMPYGTLPNIAKPSGLFDRSANFQYSGFGLDRYLASTCLAVASQVSAKAKTIIAKCYLANVPTKLPL